MPDLKMSDEMRLAIMDHSRSDVVRDIEYREQVREEDQADNRKNFRLQVATFVVAVLSLIASLAGMLITLFAK